MALGVGRFLGGLGASSPGTGLCPRTCGVLVIGNHPQVLRGGLSFPSGHLHTLLFLLGISAAPHPPSLATLAKYPFRREESAVVSCLSAELHPCVRSALACSSHKHSLSTCYLPGVVTACQLGVGLIERKSSALAGVAQLVGASSHKLKVCRFDSCAPPAWSQCVSEGSRST